MGNAYFKFKQFKIHQDQCAMKVCTDACLFGAMAADFSLQHINKKEILHCLDIGTGTGLLPLMLAQKNEHLFIDAVEIEAAATIQAKENIESSPWGNRIRVFNEDILTFSPGKQYDLIISNPPFFEDDLQSPEAAKNNAKHNTSLTLKELVDFAVTHLSMEGYLGVLLPFRRVDYFKEEALRQGFRLNSQVLVKQTFKHKYFRGILFFSRRESVPQYSELFIKDADQHYTPEFSALLKDYYLFL